jgi:hypothetical protein
LTDEIYLEKFEREDTPPHLQSYSPKSPNRFTKSDLYPRYLRFAFLTFLSVQLVLVVFRWHHSVSATLWQNLAQLSLGVTFFVMRDLGRSTIFGRRIVQIFIAHNAVSMAVSVREFWSNKALIVIAGFPLTKSVTLSILALELVWTIVGVMVLRRDLKIFLPELDGESVYEFE